MLGRFISSYAPNTPLKAQRSLLSLRDPFGLQTGHSREESTPLCLTTTNSSHGGIIYSLPFISKLYFMLAIHSLTDRNVLVIKMVYGE